jgi:hypothetical protein
MKIVEKRSEIKQRTNKLFLFVCAFLLVLLASEFFIHKHTFFKWEEWPWFYAAFGFVAFVVLILTAKYILRPIIKRREDYYD